MMKYFLIAMFGILGLIGLGFAFNELLNSGAGSKGVVDMEDTAPPSVVETALPVPDIVTVHAKRMAVLTTDGGVVAVRDIRENPNVSHAVPSYGPDFYDFSGTGTSGTQYAYSFIPAEGRFSIVLPAGSGEEDQRDAERVLQQILAIEAADLCRLHLVVDVIREGSGMMSTQGSLTCGTSLPMAQ